MSKGYSVAEKLELTRRFDHDDVGDVKEYVDYQVDLNEIKGWMKLKQPVLV